MANKWSQGKKKFHFLRILCQLIQKESFHLLLVMSFFSWYWQEVEVNESSYENASLRSTGVQARGGFQVEAHVHDAVRFAEPLTKVALSKAKLKVVRLVKFVHPPPSAGLYDRWYLLQHRSEDWIRSWIPPQKQQQQVCTHNVGNYSFN